MTAEQHKQVEALSSCRLGYWNQSGRFIGQLLEKPETELTDQQEWYLKFLCYKHRRQLKRFGIQVPRELPIRPDKEKQPMTVKVTHPSELPGRKRRPVQYDVREFWTAKEF
ncbi:MAG: hypothetical protein AB1553_01900 [Nitrospirota bacterium]